MVHRGKTQLSFSSETQQSFREPTAIFLRTWQSYREHNNQQFFFEVRCPLSRDGYPKVEREVNHLQFQAQESEDGQICNHKHRDWFSNVRRFQAHERQVPSTKSQIRNTSRTRQYSTKPWRNEVLTTVLSEITRLVNCALRMKVKWVLFQGPLEKYKEDLGKTYTHITLFLCPLEDASDTHEPEWTCTSR